MGTVEQLRERADQLITVAHDCDCNPEDTVQWRQAALAKEAAEEIESLRQQLAAALAACEVKQAALQEMIDLMSESYGLTGFHQNGDVAPWSELEEGGRFERLTSLNDALAIQPDASALKAHDEALIERCAEVCEEYQGSSETCASAIRALKESL